MYLDNDGSTILTFRKKRETTISETYHKEYLFNFKEVNDRGDDVISIMMVKLCKTTCIYLMLWNLVFAYKIINAYNEYNMITLKLTQALRSTTTKRYIH